MSSGLMRVWCCDVERCRAMHCSAVHTDITPSSYRAPDGWWAGRPWLKANHNATYAVYLCPGHADRGAAYSDALAEWTRLRAAAVAEHPDWAATQESRTRLWLVMQAWTAENPHPVIRLGEP